MIDITERQEQKPLLPQEPHMPKIDEAAVELKEDEQSSDPYLAQLALQKANRVQSAQDLLEKAQKDPKANKVIKNQGKRSKGRGRGRGRGAEEKPAAAGEDTGGAEEAKENAEPVEGGADGEGLGEEAEGDGLAPKAKKSSRKELSPDELKTMWTMKASWLSYIIYIYIFLFIYFFQLHRSHD